MTQSRHARQGWPVSMVRSVLVAAAVSSIAACSSSAPDVEAGSPAPSREADYASCARLLPTHLPAGWIPLDSRLENLGDRTFGRVDTYGAGSDKVEIYVGVDALEALEDLDFEASVVESGGQRFRLFETPVDESLLALRDERGEGKCGTRTVLSRALDREQLLAITLGLREDAVPG